MKTYVFINRVYPPAGGATGELLKELAEGLVADGARVVVVTSRGAKDQRGKGLRDQGQETAAEAETSGSSAPAERGQTKGRDVVNGVEVIRVGVASFTRASHWRRAWSYLTLYPQLMWQVWKLGRVDAVISMTDPPLQVVAVTLASCRAEKKIHWAQDVYPELAEELGVIPRGGFLARVLRAVSTWALRRQDEIVVVGRCMLERLRGRGLDARKIEVIPNWSQTGIAKAEDVAAMRRRLGWDQYFVVLYSGNLGLAHDFETFLEAAKRLDDGVRMVFAGEGPRLAELKRMASGLPWVHFLSAQPKQDLAAFLGAADVHLVSVRAGLDGLVVPSKAYGILAAGRPIIYVGSTKSEIGMLLGEWGVGSVLANGDGAALAVKLRELADGLRVRSEEIQDKIGLPKGLQRWKEILES